MNTTQYLAAILIAIIACAGGCADQGVMTTMVADNEGQIERALQKLLAQRGDGGFVIIEESTTGKFVQFAGSAAEGLLLDLPLQAMSLDEQDRATELFAALEVAREPDGFQMDFDHDAKRGASMTQRIFREVFELPGDAELKITID